MRVPCLFGSTSPPSPPSTARRAITLVVSGLGSTPESTMQTAARWAGGSVQGVSSAWAAAAWLVKTPPAPAGAGASTSTINAAVATQRPTAAGRARRRWTTVVGVRLRRNGDLHRLGRRHRVGVVDLAAAHAHPQPVGHLPRGAREPVGVLERAGAARLDLRERPPLAAVLPLDGEVDAAA